MNLYSGSQCAHYREIYIYVYIYIYVKLGNEKIPRCIRPAQIAKFPIWRESCYFNFHFHPKTGQEIKISIK